MTTSLSAMTVKDAAVRRACEAVLAAPEQTWSSARLARTAGTSPVRLQRAFRDVLGLSPRDYVVACRRRRFLNTVKGGLRVTDAIYEAGFGSPSRVYESIRLPGMTPATYGRGGRGAAIRWRSAPTGLGRVMVAATARGLCFVQIGADDTALLAELRREFPLATIDRRPSRALTPWIDAAVAASVAKPLNPELPLDIRGTAFQWRVWRALTRIPLGDTRSYADVARAIGTPKAVRAVARACATNPIPLVVPCHRVVPRAGGVGGYRWGANIKKRLLEAEARGRG